MLPGLFSVFILRHLAEALLSTLCEVDANLATPVIRPWLPTHIIGSARSQLEFARRPGFGRTWIRTTDRFRIREALVAAEPSFRSREMPTSPLPAPYPCRTELLTRAPPTSSLRHGSRARAARLRPLAEEPGQRGGTPTHSSTRESLHDGPDPRSVGSVSSVASVARCQTPWLCSPSGVKVRQTQPPGRHGETQSGPFRAIHVQAFWLQKDCNRVVVKRGANAISLQITGGRTWIRTRDLFLIREAL